MPTMECRIERKSRGYPAKIILCAHSPLFNLLLTKLLSDNLRRWNPGVPRMLSIPKNLRWSPRVPWSPIWEALLQWIGTIRNCMIERLSTHSRHVRLCPFPNEMTSVAQFPSKCLQPEEFFYKGFGARSSELRRGRCPGGGGMYLKRGEQNS